MLVRVVLAIGELLAGCWLGAMAGLWWGRRSEPIEPYGGPIIDAKHEQPLVGGLFVHAGGGGAIAQRAYEPAGETRGGE
ncbi:MAG: hypothetical protein ACYCXW_00825 [Solirubrobacteraceae bacterium]